MFPFSRNSARLITLGLIIKVNGVAFLGLGRLGETHLRNLVGSSGGPGCRGCRPEHYRIGGIAETFTFTLLLTLVEQGRISLDDKISCWFPNLLAADQVKVRMLVANTAGHIDTVTVKDFLNLQLAEPFRTFTDDELKWL